MALKHIFFYYASIKLTDLLRETSQNFHLEEIHVVVFTIKFVRGNTPTMVNEKKTDNLSQSSDNPILTNVSSHDVLFGRGKQSRNHRGNLEFLKYVRSRRQEYQQCNLLCNKAVIVKQVIHMVQSQMDGRFLKPVSTSLIAAKEDASNTDNQTSW